MTTDSATRVFDTIEDFRAEQGQLLGVGDWMQITQDRIDAFADVTEDWQWIHVDPSRASQGPYGAPIAHGYLTLSLIPVLGRRIFSVGGARLTINYGTHKVRFPQPVTVGARIRAAATLVSVEDVSTGVQAVVRYTIEIEGQTKPACVAETIRIIVP